MALCADNFHQGAFSAAAIEFAPIYYQTAEQIWGKTPPARARQLAAELETIAIDAERIAAQTSKPKRKGTS